LTDLRINSELSIPMDELRFTASRAGGPGGQHVNKVSSRVTLHFDVDGSPSLEESQRRRLHERLPTRINREGILRLHVQLHRSQSRNRELAVERFAELLRDALRRRRSRRRTRVPRSQKERRLESKRRRSAKKEGRKPVRES
jgi:ribosome-associated protein